jgi:hypothetical protein
MLKFSGDLYVYSTHEHDLADYVLCPGFSRGRVPEAETRASNDKRQETVPPRIVAEKFFGPRRC